jgi:hypothetical protein
MNKIDLIIDALELARNEIHDPTLWTDKVDEALAAARELRELKPVAWAAIDKETNNWFVTTCFDAQECEIPLYALDEVTK